MPVSLSIWALIVVVTLLIVYFAVRYTPDPFKKVNAQLRPRIIFTMTTIPSRLEHIDGVLKDLAKSAVDPDAIYLNIPDVSRREGTKYDIPAHIQETIDLLGITLVRCQDVGPATKFFPILAREPQDTIMLLVDDDQRYPEHAFDELVKYSLNNPHEAVGYRGLNVSAKGEISYVESGSGKVDVLETYAGVAIRVRHLQGYQPPDPNNECFTCDDISIHAQLKQNGVPRVLLPGSRYGKGGNEKYPIHHNDHIAGMNPLNDENLKGRNEECARRLFL